MRTVSQGNSIAVGGAILGIIKSFQALDFRLLSVPVGVGPGPEAMISTAVGLLIDVMFLLVAFFLVTSVSMVMQKGIFVDLSPPQTGEKSPDDRDSIVLSVDDSGRFLVDRQEITDEDLQTELFRIAAPPSGG